MELNINSPAYFTNYYGVDDEVYSYCQNLHNFFKTKEYSETLTYNWNNTYCCSKRNI